VPGIKILFPSWHTREGRHTRECLLYLPRISASIQRVSSVGFRGQVHEVNRWEMKRMGIMSKGVTTHVIGPRIMLTIPTYNLCYGVISGILA